MSFAFLLYEVLIRKITEGEETCRVAKEGRLIKTFSVLLEFLYVILAVVLHILIIVSALLLSLYILGQPYFHKTSTY